MANANEERIKQAAAAIKAGRKPEARDILLAVVDEDERNEKAWLYLSGLVETLEEQQICLENVLAINPDNGKAQRGLQQIQQRTPIPQPENTPETDVEFPSPFSAGTSDIPAPPAAHPYGGGPIGTEYDSLSGGSFTGESFDARPAQPAADSGGLDWMSSGFDLPATPETTDRDPFAPATSVEWAREDGPTAYGSGKQIDLPSAQEYDDWVQGLNLSNPPLPEPAQKAGQDAGNESSPFILDENAPFGDTSFMVDSGPFDATPPPSPAEEDDSAGVFSGATWEDEPESAFGIPETPAPAEPNGGSGFASLEDSLRSSIAFDDDAGHASDAVNPFMGLEASASPLSDGPTRAKPRAGRKPTPAPAVADAPAKTAPRATGTSAPAARTEDYFRYIPADIDVETGSTGRAIALLGAILVLIILNAASFAYLLL